MDTTPLLVFDTNILMDVLLGRNGAAAVLLVELAEKKRVDLVVPEYVLFEFRGTALRWIRNERDRLNAVRRSANEWIRSQELGEPADEIQNAAQRIARKLEELQDEVDVVFERIRAVADVREHTIDLHFRGDLRYLKGLPPDRPVDGIKDCRIYEAVLEVATSEQGVRRPKFLVTRDSDFDYPRLVEELTDLGFEIRNDPGRLYGQLKAQMSPSG